MTFEGTYVWKLRQALGSQRLLISGVGAFIVTPEGKLWLGRRTESGEWSYFGGAMELGDSVVETVIKEVHEETGLVTVPGDWTFFGVHSVPGETNFSYPNGDAVQVVNNLFTMVLDSELVGGDDGEHDAFAAFALDELPANMKVDTLPVVALYKEFVRTGNVQVK
jgi:8-oxo-dGTP pyrophosphatase MutT (NUDIX family)